jgi:hypothetical protein
MYGVITMKSSHINVQQINKKNSNGEHQKKFSKAQEQKGWKCS